MRIADYRNTKHLTQPAAQSAVAPHIIFATRSAYSGGMSPQRRRLFHYVTAAALRGQTDPDFTWLIHVDPNEDTAWRNQVTADLNVTYTTQTFGDWLASVSLLNAHAELPPTRMVRLDDDDAVTIDFVERLRAAGPYRPGTWYTFPQGYRVHAGKCAPYTNRPNQFIAYDVPPLVVPPSGGAVRHVYSINHRDLERDDFPDPIIEVDQRPAWLFLRHDESKSPGGRQPTTQPLSTLAGLFSVDHHDLITDVPADQRVRLDWPCRHRGSELETLHCRPCDSTMGLSDIPVFECSHPQRTHHPRCTVYNVGAGARGSDGLRPQACATCNLRKEL